MSPSRVPGYLRVGFLALFLTLLTLVALGCRNDPIPWTGPVPKASCGPGDRTESGLQGQTTPAERSTNSQLGYNCNLELVGQYLGEGAKSQGGPAYLDTCAYYDTNNNPMQQHRGVVVIDASDPAHPKASTFLDDPVMLDPHETLKAKDRKSTRLNSSHLGIS